MCFSIIADLMASSDVCLSVGGRALDAWIRPQRTILGMARAPFLVRISCGSEGRCIATRRCREPLATNTRLRRWPRSAQRCTRALCDPCIVYDLSSPHCIDCARVGAAAARDSAPPTKIAGVLAAVAGGIVFVATRPHPFDYGADSEHIMRLHNNVQAERCSQRATLEYDEALVAAGDARGALADTEAYFGEMRRLVSAALGHLWRARAPRRARSGVGRGEPAHCSTTRRTTTTRGGARIAYEEMGRLDDAIADYRRALTLTPGLDRIPFNLANLLEQKGQFCAARQPILQFVHYHPEFAHQPNVIDRLDRLRILGHCAADPPPSPPDVE